MIDKEFIKSILFPEDTESKKIKPGDHITAELVELMQAAPQKRIRECFAVIPKREKGEALTKYKYSIEVECKHCHKRFVREMGKEDIILYISYNGKADAKNKNWRVKDVLCSECTIIAENDRKKEMVENKKRWEQYQHDATAMFIEVYLKAGWDFEKPSNKNYWELFNACRGCGISTIAAHIKAMDYHDFLDTPYWKAIARYVKHKAGYKCMMCGGTGKLNVHHRDYKCHGYELQQCGSELICLCNNCHKWHHNK